MNEDRRYLHVWLFVSVLFVCCNAVLKCNSGETLENCQKLGGTFVTFCAGGSTGIDLDDLLCILRPNSACDTDMRNDTCGQCDSKLEIAKTTTGSRYRDCNGDCFTAATQFDMKVNDICNVCGGDNSTCVTFATDLSVKFVPDNEDSDLVLTGSGLKVPGVMVLLVRVILSTPTTISLMQIVENTSHRSAIVRLLGGSVTAGVCEVRAGTNISATGALAGPALQVYASADYTVTSITPATHDLDPSETNIPVVMTLDIPNLSGGAKKNKFDTILTLVGRFYCFIKDSQSAPLSMTRRYEGTMDSISGNLTCTVPTPPVSTDTWLCASLNGQHKIGDCLEVKFYQVAPRVQDNNISMTITDMTMLEVIFNMPVTPPSTHLSCGTFFNTISTFGTSPRCLLSNDRTRITLYPGDGSTLEPGNTVQLAAGFTSSVGRYRHQTAVLDLTVVMSTVEIPNTMRLVMKGSVWPTLLTNHSPNPITLAIEALDMPDDRPPESVRWTLNGNNKDEWDDSLEVSVNVGEVGDYLLAVTVTDFLGNTATLTHTLRKTATPLPSVLFFPAVLQPISEGRYQTYPNTVFAINCRITYDTSVGLNGYNFTWFRDGVQVPGQYYYKSTTTENTIMMCNTSVVYSLTVSVVGDPSNNIEYPLTVLIQCRDPVARIKGNPISEAITDSEDPVVVDGRFSYDPDGGPLEYLWTCRQTGDKDCMSALSITVATASKLSFPATLMSSNNDYVFSLTVRVNKSDGIHQAETQKTIRATLGRTPVVRMVTQRTKFRHDSPIMMKAYIGKETSATWSFVQKEGFDYVTLNESVGTATQLVEAYTWFTIYPNVLLPGRKYTVKLHAYFDDHNTVFTDKEHELYIYEELRSCSLQATAMTELAETTVSLKGCLKDSAAGEIRANCHIEDQVIPSGIDLSFHVPVFRDRSIQRTNVTCLVQDKVGHKMEVTSNVVDVTLVNDVITSITNLVDNLKTNDRFLEAVDVLASKIAADGDGASARDQVQVLDLVRIYVDPTIDETVRLLLSVSKLQPARMYPYTLKLMAGKLDNLLGRLCSQTVAGTPALTLKDTQVILDKVSELTLRDHTIGPIYRSIGEKIACVRFKGLKNEESETAHKRDGSGVRYLYRTLDDVTFIGVNITFPSAMKKIYRDVWQCGATELCHGVGLKIEHYPRDPPDLQTGRTDTDCAIYVNLDIFNPYNGSEIRIKDLEGRININFGRQCPRATCWWYNFVVDRWDQSGVVAVPQEDGTINCETHHLSMFSVRSEPLVSTALNIPYIVAIPVGLLGFLVSLFVVLKVLVQTIKAGKELELLEESKDDDPDDYSPSPSPYPMQLFKPH